MNRRFFLKNGTIAAVGSTIINPYQSIAHELDLDTFKKNKIAKNIIFLVSDGMSSGTLNMADLYLNRKLGSNSNWIQLYKDNKVSRALMETSSANSIVTDSAAGGSAWGTGFKVNNGSICVGINGEEYLPVWQKFKKAGKMAGCVTTVPITHATPSSFCVNSKSRKGQEEIAEKYLNINFDIMMGGGFEYFDASTRKDKRDLFSDFEKKGYQIVKNRDEMLASNNKKPILGIFGKDEAMPFSLDMRNDATLQSSTPTLSEMTQKAIDKMKDNPKGFVLQVEGGKVDWAAHSNDIGGLLYDQVAFDDAIKIAIDFAEKDKETLVIITTDHGNGNPGIVYGKNANANFDSLQNYKFSNERILNSINKDTSLSQIKEIIEFGNGKTISEEDAKIIMGFYSGLKKSEGLYNFKNLPYQELADMQTKNTSVGWISMEHTADHVELAMFGPGSKLMKPFMKNTDLHYLMLQAAEIENKF
jgi:alkaline phosphatase